MIAVRKGCVVKPASPVRKERKGIKETAVHKVWWVPLVLKDLPARLAMTVRKVTSVHRVKRAIKVTSVRKVLPVR